MVEQLLFSHPLESAAREELLKTIHFKEQIKEHYIHYEEKRRRPDLLGKTVQINDTQFPHIYQIAERIKTKTGIPVPDLFVYEDIFYAIDSKGMQEPWIEISASMIADFSDSELEFLIAREMGKIHLKHTSLHMMINQSLAMYKSGMIPFSEGVVEDVVRTVYYRWSRLSHFSIDSFGYLVCRDLHAATQAITKCVLNSVFLSENLNITAYIQQAEAINLLHDSVYEATKSDEPYPYGPLRIKNLIAYASSERAMSVNKQTI